MSAKIVTATCRNAKRGGDRVLFYNIYIFGGEQCHPHKVYIIIGTGLKGTTMVTTTSGESGRKYLHIKSATTHPNYSWHSTAV